MEPLPSIKIIEKRERANESIALIARLIQASTLKIWIHNRRWGMDIIFKTINSMTLWQSNVANADAWGCDEKEP